MNLKCNHVRCKISFSALLTSLDLIWSLLTEVIILLLLAWEIVFKLHSKLEMMKFCVGFLQHLSLLSILLSQVSNMLFMSFNISLEKLLIILMLRLTQLSHLEICRLVPHSLPALRGLPVVPPLPPDLLYLRLLLLAEPHELLLHLGQLRMDDEVWLEADVEINQLKMK